MKKYQERTEGLLWKECCWTNYQKISWNGFQGRSLKRALKELSEAAEKVSQWLRLRRSQTTWGHELTWTKTEIHQIFSVYLKVYLLLSLVVACVLTHHEYGEGGGSGVPDTTVEASGGVIGLIQLNTDGFCWKPQWNAHKDSFVVVVVVVVVVVSCCSGPRSS